MRHSYHYAAPDIFAEADTQVVRLRRALTDAGLRVCRNELDDRRAIAAANAVAAARTKGARCK